MQLEWRSEVIFSRCSQQVSQTDSLEVGGYPGKNLKGVIEVVAFQVLSWLRKSATPIRTDEEICPGNVNS